MIENIYLALKAFGKPVFINLRSVNEAPADTEEFLALYIDSENIISINDIETVYAVIYARKKDPDKKEFENSQELYSETSKIVDTLLNNLPTSSANITYGTNDFFDFSLIKLLIKHRRRK